IHDAPTGFSYPSGHAVFFTWVSFMLVAVASPSLRPGWRLLISILAGVQIALACIGRVWVGVHWPTDVIGGFLLALGWCLLVLWLAERRRPHPPAGGSGSSLGEPPRCTEEHLPL